MKHCRHCQTDCDNAGSPYNLANCCCKYSAGTNADHIRSMTDEELAEQLISYRDDWSDYETHVGCFDKYEDAVKAEVRWLKQPHGGG